ncbi:hypothetical protein [Cribrihabitans marinus]|nr:hypothetical protein [Cribrihabitans marinus]GGH21215.1 hypothetical protein GCM10010973_05670 [Cribrihabitans marinus]
MRSRPRLVAVLDEPAVDRVVGHANLAVRAALGAGGLTMIAGGWITDLIGVGLAIALVLIQKGVYKSRGTSI